MLSLNRKYGKIQITYIFDLGFVVDHKRVPEYKTTVLSSGSDSRTLQRVFDIAFWVHQTTIYMFLYHDSYQ